MIRAESPHRSVFFDDSVATDAVSGQPTTLALNDPDTNYVMPDASPRFAGQLATVGQADGQIVFGSKIGKLHALNLTDPAGLNSPPIVDGRPAQGHSAFAFRPEDTALQQEFNKALADVMGTPAFLEAMAPFGLTRDNLPDTKTADLCR